MEAVRLPTITKKIVAEHNERMTELLAYQSVKELRFNNIQLTETVLRDELIDEQCNPNSEIDILLCRLLRATKLLLKENKKFEQLTPWFEFNKAT